MVTMGVDNSSKDHLTTAVGWLGLRTGSC